MCIRDRVIMNSFSELHKYDGLGLAELVRTKQISPAELVEYTIARIETHNPKINAVIHRMYDKARKVAESKLPEGSFMGVPFLLKDATDTVEGEPTSSGTSIQMCIRDRGKGGFQHYCHCERSEAISGV